MLTDNFGASPGHNIQTISIQARKSNQLRKPLCKHNNNRQCNAAFLLFNRPSIDKHAPGHNNAHREQNASKTVFGDTLSTPSDPFLDDVVCPPPTEECAEQVAAAGCEVEKARVQRGSEAETWVYDVADWGKEGVHVPDQASGCYCL